MAKCSCGCGKDVKPGRKTYSKACVRRLTSRRAIKTNWNTPPVQIKRKAPYYGSREEKITFE